MSFIVIEGLDGSGKSTQIKSLRTYLEKKGIDYFFLHFPRTDAPVFGEMIARFLRGELGRIEEVDPYLVALLYAGDRMDAATIIRNESEKGKLVLVDRYVYSNIAFQCAKPDKPADQEKLRDWILYMEYEHFHIPKPDLNIFLDVPFSFTAEKLKERQQSETRKYLEGQQDIHEKDLAFQQRVREIYLRFAASQPDCISIPCYDEKEKMLPADRIFEKIVKVLKENKIL